MQRTWNTINIFSIATNATATFQTIENLMQNNHTKIGVFLQFDCDASIDIVRTVRF